MTQDVDALACVSEDRWTSVLSAAQRYGIEARIESPLDFALRTRILLVRHVETGVDIDVLLGGLSYQADAVGRGTFHDLGGVRVRLPQVEDLLIMKALAQRPQDIRDIEGLLDLHPKADIGTVRQWVREFSTAMTMPDLLEGFEKLLEQRKPIRKASSKSKRQRSPKTKSRPPSRKKANPKSRR